jgi:3-oxoacyl-[acyl-carrier protein] reductase/meso-butanediol dehydrogenase/(S,S)-butanediol dehydrogenase/diacetyl reductase
MSPERANIVAITGVSRGIGRGIAELFLSRGWRVAGCSRSAIEAPPAGLRHWRADVGRRQDVRAFVRGAVEAFGGLDALVNAAGVSRWRAVQDLDEAFVEELIRANVMGTLWGCAEAAAVLRPGGAIVNVSSLAGKRGSANNSAYCASKFAVNGITQSLAKELGPRSIRVNAVCPVYVRTEHVLASLAEAASPAQGKDVDAYLASFASTQTALGRLPTAQEVAETVFFLAGPAASAITGQCLNVDCGTLPQ